MSGHRRGPVGRGYMPKGGVKAAQRSNEVWRESNPSQVPANCEPPSVDPTVTVARVESQVRTRQRVVAWLSTETLARLGAATGVLALLLELGHR